MPYVIGFLATLPAAWLALGTRRPLAPAVPLVVALAATIPLGVLVPSLLVPRGIVLAIVLVAWGAFRAQRTDEAPSGSARGSAAAVTAAQGKVDSAKQALTDDLAKQAEAAESSSASTAASSTEAATGGSGSGSGSWRRSNRSAMSPAGTSTRRSPLAPSWTAASMR